MSGGTCEASGFAAFGYATTGIAFPLGNYHNATPEGGVDAEYIHVDDYLYGVRLVEEAARKRHAAQDVAGLDATGCRARWAAGAASADRVAIVEAASRS